MNLESLLRHRPSPAMAVALAALTVALGGTGYAAFKLPANSVGTAQLKKNAVTSAKVKDGTLQLLDFAPAEQPKLKGNKGEQGERGPQGQQGREGGPQG